MINKVWLNQYTHNVPATIDPDQFTSLVHLFEKYSNDFATRPAFVNFGTTLSYRQLQQHALHFAAFLQNTLRLKKGARFAIMMPNILQYPVAIFGALKAGLIVVNVNPLYTAPEIIHQFKPHDFGRSNGNIGIS